MNGLVCFVLFDNVRGRKRCLVNENDSAFNDLPIINDEVQQRASVSIYQSKKRSRLLSTSLGSQANRELDAHVNVTLTSTPVGVGSTSNHTNQLEKLNGSDIRGFRFPLPVIHSDATCNSDVNASHLAAFTGSNDVANASPSRKRKSLEIPVLNSLSHTPPSATLDPSLANKSRTAGRNATQKSLFQQPETDTSHSKASVASHYAAAASSSRNRKSLHAPTSLGPPYNASDHTAATVSAGKAKRVQSVDLESQ